MVIVGNVGKALAAKKVVVAGQLWQWKEGRWQCDRCAAGWPRISTPNAPIDDGKT
jgi:hypothetical protein